MKPFWRRRAPAPDSALRGRFEAAWSAYEAGQQEDGIALLRAVLADEESSTWWFDLGLMHKWRQEWQPCLEANVRAAQLDPGNTPAYWNGGIAATALHDWPTARRMWASYGVQLPDESGEPQGSLGHTPVRVDLSGGTEVVWCDRLDPARARIENVPTPDCDRRWHDIVLHDGEPKGERKLGRRWVPVFDEISLWRQSPVPKLRAEVTAASPRDVEALMELVEDAGRRVEDWTSSVQPLCRACSEGRPEHDHEHPVMDDWSVPRVVGFGCEPDLALQLLDAWVAAAPGSRDHGPVERL